MKFFRNKSDWNEYRQYVDAGLKIEYGLRLGIIWVTIFGILWPERNHVDLTCGIDE